MFLLLFIAILVLTPSSYWDFLTCTNTKCKVIAEAQAPVDAKKVEKTNSSYLNCLEKNLLNCCFL